MFVHTHTHFHPHAHNCGTHTHTHTCTQLCKDSSVVCRTPKVSCALFWSSLVFTTMSLCLAAVEKQKLVYILNRDASARLTISSPLEAHKSHTIVFNIVGVDVGFENPMFATLELDYEVGGASTWPPFCPCFETYFCNVGS